MTDDEKRVADELRRLADAAERLAAAHAKLAEQANSFRVLAWDVWERVIGKFFK